MRRTLSTYQPLSRRYTKPYRLQVDCRPWQRASQRCLWSSQRVEETTIDSQSNKIPGSDSSDSKLSATGISLATRMATDRKFECTQFDKKGEIHMGHGHIQRSELVSKYGILSRDLRKIDHSHFPAILVRQSTILVNLLHFRVLITHEDVLVLHVYKPNEAESGHISAFMYELQGKLQLVKSVKETFPYELRALETILIMVMSELEVEFQELKEPVLKVLQDLDHDVSLEKLKRLADVSRQLSGFQQKVKLIREALRTVLDADDDMAAMYLSEKAIGQVRRQEDHEEVELLFENYYECSGEIMEKSEQLLSDVDITHDSVKSILDSHRNSIMMLDVKLSVAMLSLGGGTYIAGLYGMNVVHGLEEASNGFLLTAGGSVFAAVFFALYGARRVWSISHKLRLQNGHADFDGRRTRSGRK